MWFVLPGNVAYDHSLLPAVASFFASCVAMEAHDVGRPCGCRFCNVVQCLVFHDWAERLSGYFVLPSPLHTAQEYLLSLVVHCLDLVGPEVNLFPWRSMRKMTYLSCPNSFSGVGRLRSWGDLT